MGPPAAGAPPAADAVPDDAARVTSLSLGHAAAIAMAEVVRQRRARTPKA
jgi:hypothetical protein